LACSPREVMHCRAGPAKTGYAPRNYRRPTSPDL
jgi:hypothetical protein